MFDKSNNYLDQCIKKKTDTEQKDENKAMFDINFVDVSRETI